MTDEHGNVLSFFNEPVLLETEGDIEIIGPKVIALQGGMGGTYIRSLSKEGEAVLKISNAQSGSQSIQFKIKGAEQ